MINALLIVTLLTAEEAVISKVEPDEWPLEGRRVHYGVGVRVHGGVLDSVSVLRPLMQSEFTFFVSIRVFGHHEWRVGVGLAAGVPDWLAGETNVSFRFHLGPRLAIGAGLFTYWGFSAMRGGLELPLAVRLGANRRHELTFCVRGTAGAFNNGVTIAWYDFRALAPAFTVDAVVGYAALF